MVDNGNINGIDLRKHLCNNVRIVIFMVEIMETNTSNSVRKITAHIPTELLDSAQSFTGLGITETLKEGLEHLKKAHAYKKLRSLRGKLNLEGDIDELRSDRNI